MNWPVFCISFLVFTPIFYFIFAEIVNRGNNSWDRPTGNKGRFDKQPKTPHEVEEERKRQAVDYWISRQERIVEERKDKNEPH